MRCRQVISVIIIVTVVSGCAPLSSMKGPRIFVSNPESRFPVESEFEIPKPTDYLVSIEDLLEVNVWQHPDLSKEVTVRPDGKISYLLIGDIQAEGRTVAELDDVITRKFEEYARGLETEELKEAAQPVRKEYRIGLNDHLRVSIWKVPDLSVDVIVRPDGKISYPLIGDIEAYGKTLTELDDELTEALKKYIKDPQVSIMITAFGELERKRIAFVTEFITTFLEEKPEVSVLVKRFGSRKVVVLGRVRAPGIYDLKGDARILDAVAYAGGFTDDAVKDNIFIIRGNINSNPTVIKVNVWDIIRRGNYAMNLKLQGQDIVYAPRSIVGNINVLIGQVQPTVSLLYESVILKDALKATFKMDD